jgi:hypothetical protein
MSAIDVRFRLNELLAERALASMEGLAGDGAYMEDLDDELVATRHAYIAPAITEIAVLRAELSAPQLGWEGTSAASDDRDRAALRHVGVRRSVSTAGEHPQSLRLWMNRRGRVRPGFVENQHCRAWLGGDACLSQERHSCR